MIKSLWCAHKRPFKLDVVVQRWEVVRVVTAGSMEIELVRQQVRKRRLRSWQTCRHKSEASDLVPFSVDLSNSHNVALSNYTLRTCAKMYKLCAADASNNFLVYDILSHFSLTFSAYTSPTVVEHI